MDFAGMARAFADAAVTALWQSAALALAVWMSLRLAPRTSAADRFRIWAAGFAAVVALPLLPAFAALLPSLFAAGASAAPAAFASPAAAPHPWLELNPGWTFVVAGLWVAASVARAADLAAHSVRLRGLWKRAVPVTAAGLATRTTPGLETGATTFEVCTTRELDRPSVIGFFRPRILIPEWLMQRLTPAELEQVVLHEAEHLRRRDDWTNLLQKLCLVAFPINPALLWMERRLCREREMACDEGVVRRTQAPRAYAACLTSLAQRGLEHRRAAALSLGAWQRRPELVERVHRILRRAPGLSPAAARALVGAVACGLVLGAAEFARCPQLVEFAAPAVQATALSGDANPLPGFRAVNAVAHVPARAEMARMRDGGSWSPAHSQKARMDGARVRMRDGGSWSPAPSQEARMDGARSRVVQSALKGADAQGAAGPQEMMVFTAWEQVETVAPAVRSDGPSAAQAEDGSAAAHSAPQRMRQYTVTRLIVRVYSAGGAKAGARSRTSSNLTGLPVPLRDGWLVLQL